MWEWKHLSVNCNTFQLTLHHSPSIEQYWVLTFIENEMIIIIIILVLDPNPLNRKSHLIFDVNTREKKITNKFVVFANLFTLIFHAAFNGKWKELKIHFVFAVVVVCIRVAYMYKKHVAHAQTNTHIIYIYT